MFSYFFDGHRHVEDIHFACMSMDRMVSVQGCLGVVEPWKGSKDKLDATSKTNRSVACIDQAIDDFATQFADGYKSWAYNNGRDDAVAQAIRTKTHAITADRRAEAQLAARSVADQKIKSVGMVAPDTGHMFKSWCENSAKHEPKMLAIEMACFKNKLAPGKLLRYSAKERESLIAY